MRIPLIGSCHHPVTIGGAHNPQVHLGKEGD